jgi:hypothetical protein
VDLAQGLDTLLAAAVVAALAPVVVALLPGPRIPQVVVLLAGGVLIGPEVLDWASRPAIDLLANVGLGFLFLLAGYELDLRLFRERPGRLAIVAWLVSVALAVALVGALAAAGLVRAFVPVALGLTTTALGTLPPILRDEDRSGAGRQARSSFGVGPVWRGCWFAAAARDCLRMVTRYLTPSMVRSAVMTAIRIGAVWSAPTWVRNAAISTIENGAGATEPGTAASRQENASPSGTPGKTWWTSTPAVPPMNREGKMGPPTNPLPWLTAKVSILAMRMAMSRPNPRVPASLSTVLS